MPLTDLADVTRSLTRLLELGVGRLNTAPVTVTPEPPEEVVAPDGEGAMNTLSLHLYHVSEDPHYKNLPGAGSDPPNVAKNPMGLCLYYILTAHHSMADAPQNALIQQSLLGHAMKTLHDNPVITERTRAGDPPMGESMAPLVWPEPPVDPEQPEHELTALRNDNNQIEIILRPVTPEDAMAFWGTEERQTTRFSAYYEARVMFLEPEPPTRIAAPVLEIGQFVFQLGAPTLESSRSQVLFTVPGPEGGVQSTPSSPARVTLNIDEDLAEHNRLQLIGANLSSGTSRSLLLSTPLWEGEFAVDLLLNSGWSVVFAGNRVDVTLTDELAVAGIVDPQPVRPGIYAARVSAVVAEQILAGALRQQTVSSNTITFAVAPRLIVPAEQPDPGAAGLIRINVGGEFSLIDDALTGDAIQVTVDGLPYERVDDPPLASQQFSVRDNDGISNAVRLNPHAGLSNAGLHPFRLVVNGAESAPFWINVT